jgi:hypothetical protein
MTEYRVNESKLREQQQEGAREDSCATQSSGHLVLKILAGAVVGLVAWGVITSLGDIKRYIRMTRM